MATDKMPAKAADKPADKTDKTAAGLPISESKASTGIDDPTDRDQAGDAVVTIEGDPDLEDMSDPTRNRNVGYSAEGQVVSNQQWEQPNTSQATEEERAEILDLRADTAKNRAENPDSDWATTTPHS